MLTKYVAFLKACSHRGYLRDYKKLKLQKIEIFDSKEIFLDHFKD